MHYSETAHISLSFPLPSHGEQNVLKILFFKIISLIAPSKNLLKPIFDLRILSRISWKSAGSFLDGQTSRHIYAVI